MTLTPNELISLAEGALRFSVDAEGYVSFLRFTEKQEAFYRATNPDFYKKTKATARVRLSFETDADSFSVDFRATTASSRSFCYFDLFVDGVMLDHQGSEESAPHGTLRFTLPRGTHRVTLYLPGLFAARLANFTLPDGARITPTAKPHRMLLLGDSITQGYDALYPSQSYANLISDMLSLGAVNQGIGGELFNPDVIDGNLPLTPEIITVAYGTNDYSKSTREKMTATANEFFRRLRVAFPHAQIFAILPIWRADTAVPRVLGSFEDAREIVRAAAMAQNGITVLDGDSFVPHLPAFFSDSYLHPNDLGFKFYADALCKALLPHLKKEHYDI